MAETDDFHAEDQLNYEAETGEGGEGEGDEADIGDDPELEQPQCDWHATDNDGFTRMDLKIRYNNTARLLALALLCFILVCLYFGLL